MCKLSGRQFLAAHRPGTSKVSSHSVRLSLWISFRYEGCLLMGMRILCLACSTKVNVTLSFGGKSWPINEQDMNLGPDPRNPSQCLGAISDGGVPTSSGITWIVGDTFLVSDFEWSRCYHLEINSMVLFLEKCIRRISRQPSFHWICSALWKDCGTFSDHNKYNERNQ